MIVNIVVAIVILLAVSATNAVPKPFLDKRGIAFRRAAALDDGINISWFEHTWDTGVLKKKPIKASDFQLLKHLGFKTIRLPVAFEHFQSEGRSMQKVTGYVDGLLKLCSLYGFKLIICYHSGDLNDDNYIAETQRVMGIWQKLTEKYRHQSPEKLFFDIFNEPPHMNPDHWKNIANDVIAAIRKIDRNRTLIVGASNYNSIYELSRTMPLNDLNIIYTFHFYEPFFFTHQGAEWIGDQVATTGVPFPYDGAHFPPLNPKAKGTAGEAHYNMYPKDGNEQSIKGKLQIVKDWATKYNVPLLCGEYGVYNKYADLDSRCRYIKATRQTLKTLKISAILWDYNTNFSIFEGKPSLANLPDCMKDAIGYELKQ
jgi:endoglucanase